MELIGFLVDEDQGVQVLVMGGSPRSETTSTRTNQHERKEKPQGSQAVCSR
jgi:hypothetical protein